MNQRRLALFLSLAIPVLVIFVLPPSPISPWAAAHQSLESPSAFQGEKEETTLVSSALLTQNGNENGRTGKREKQTTLANAQNVEYVSHIGSEFQVVFVQGNYAYIGEGPYLDYLSIVDVSTPTRPKWVGSIKSPDYAGDINDIFVSGTHAYVATDKRLLVVNVLDPSSPTVEGSLPAMGASVYISGSYAYVGTSGFWVVDISDPANPIQIGSCLSGGVSAVYVSGSYAYVVKSDYLHVIDISDPSHPTPMGSYETYIGKDVYVSGSYAYVLDALRMGLAVVDISDPNNPTEAAFYSIDDPQEVFVSGSYAYVTGWSNNSLLIVDVSDPTHPTTAGSYQFPGFAQGLYVSGRYAYVTYKDWGLRVLDVSNPANVAERGLYGGGALKIWISGPYAYVVTGSDGFSDQDAKGLRVINIVEPNHPIEVGFYDTPGRALDVFVADPYAYVVDQNALLIVDVADPSSPRRVGAYDPPSGVHIGVYVSGSYAYVLGPGLRIVDVSDPRNPYLVGSDNTGGSDVFVSGQYAYLPYGDGLRVVDVADPTDPREVGFCYGQPAESVYVSGSYAYLAGNNGFWVADVSDPTSPVEKGSYPVQSAYAVYVSGSYAYVATNSALLVVDVSDPANPTEVGSYPLLFGSDVHLSGPYAYVTGGSTRGLFTLQYTGAPAEFGAVSGYVTDGHGHPLANTSMALLRDGNVVSRTLTHRYGAYAFSNFPLDPAVITYTVQVTLQHGYSPTPTFRVRHTPAAADCRGGSIVYAQTAPFTLTNFHYHPIDFADATLATDPAIPQHRLDDLAAIYYHTQQVIAFAQEELNVTWNLVPLEVNTFNQNEERAFWASDRFICIGARPFAPPLAPGVYVMSDYNNNYGNRPMNREWHETFHHLMHDAFGIPPEHAPDPPNHPGDSNHGGYWDVLGVAYWGGYWNHCTGDSWAEGWAEAWSCILKHHLGQGDPRLYAHEGSRVNFEDNLQVWDWYTDTNGLEEFAAASLLWDLYDGVSDADDDHIDLTTEQLWDILGDTTYSPLQDMKDVYDALTATLPITDVNELFISHGFFADTGADGLCTGEAQENNELYEQGEEVGRAADCRQIVISHPHQIITYTIEWRRTRRNQPPMPNAYLKVNVLDADDHPLPATLQVQVAYSGTKSIYNYAYTTTVPGNGELLYLWLPPIRTVATATIQAAKFGATSDPVALDNSTYWDAVAQSTTGYALEITMTVPIHLNYLPVVLKDR